MQDYILTINHIKFKPCEPDINDIQIEDIAHALSMLCRANGHFPEFFSVAQHCLTCLEEARARGYTKKVQLACLLHDASEAYLSDITRPVKQHLPQYLEIEAGLEQVISKRFFKEELQPQEEAMVKSVDDDMLYYEFYHFTGEQLYERAPKICSRPTFSIQPFKEVEQTFLREYYKLEEAGYETNE